MPSTVLNAALAAAKSAAVIPASASPITACSVVDVATSAGASGGDAHPVIAPPSAAVVMSAVLRITFIRCICLSGYDATHAAARRANSDEPTGSTAGTRADEHGEPPMTCCRKHQ